MSSISQIRPDDGLYNLAVMAVRRLQSEGFIAYLAGGCVRDILLEAKPKDYDIATNALPSQVEHLFPGSETSGKSFAVTRSPIDGTYLEIATFRMDHGYADGRRPENISFSDAETDAQRRDFTINAIFLDPVKNEFYDFVGGENDLKAGVIRCVGDPDKRFQEDHLRMLRAIRFAGTLDFSLYPTTADAIQNNARMLTRISPERIHDELTRILLESKKPGDSIILMDKLGLFEAIIPEINSMKNQHQPPEFHPEGSVFAHTIAMLNMMEQRSPQLAYAVLFHDIGKPVTAKVDSDRLRFYGHASEGASLAEKIMRRLRFSSEEIEVITHCVRNHMRFMDVRKMKRSTLRKLVGAPTFQIEIELHRLDCLSSHGDLSNWNFLNEFQEQLAKEPILPKPWVTGNDIIKMGIPESPRIGSLRSLAYDAQLEGRFKEREELLEWLKNEIKRNL